MGYYVDQVLPRFGDVVMARKEFTAIRARIAQDLDGDVLEVGFGSGLNVPHYPSTVSHLRAVDPGTLGRKLAAKRVVASPVPVEFVGLDGQDLPVESASVDHVPVTWTLCTIPDLERALAEMCPMLRPGGLLHFVEHGRSPDVGVARWQDRLTPLQRRVAGGCHLNRPIDKLVAGSGFAMTKMDNYYAKGPRPFGYMFEGIAART